MEEKNNERSGERFLLRMFKRDINRWPQLSREEETVVARQARAGDKAAANLLVESNLRFVCYVAFKYWRPGLPFMDMISEGCLALLDALKHFDPDWGVRFISYAGKGVKNNVFDTIRLHYRHKHKSLDESVYDDGDETTYKDLLKSDDPGADETVFAGQIRKMLLDLDERERRVLILRYWDDLTLEETAAKIGLGKERVRTIENRSLRKLRWTKYAELGEDRGKSVEISGLTTCKA